MRIKTLIPAVHKKTPAILVARLLVIIMLFANLTFIWVNSAKVAKDSTKISKSVTRSVAPYVVDGYEELPKKEQKEKIKDLNPKVRTAAHMIEYVPLGALIFLLIASIFVLKSNDCKKKLFLLFLSVFLALLFSLTDEIHQIFVKGRSFELKDIGMDMIGMSLGYIGTVLVFCLLNLINQKNTDV